MGQSLHDLADRLRQARLAAGYTSPTDAARGMGILSPTYLGHENASRGYRAAAPRYADFFKVNLEWLLTGRGAMKNTAAGLMPLSTDDVPPYEVPDLTMRELNLRHLVVDLPILGCGACGEDGVFEMNGQTMGLTKRPPKLVGVPGAYALYVSGDSMEPWRFRGKMVLVNPHRMS